jgi:6-phosphogluconolactonase
LANRGTIGADAGSMDEHDLRRLATLDELADAAARLVVEVAGEAWRRDGRVTLALAGGSTPRGLYRRLAVEPFAARMAWPDMHVFWTDERHVAPDHQASNFRMADEALLRHVPVPADHVHRIPAEDPDADRAARAYDAQLRLTFGLPPGGFASFDLMLLGMGADGHTASIFPGSPAVHERERQVVAPFVETQHAYRITITPPVIANARTAIVLVSGAGKATALRDAIEASTDPGRIPIHCLRESHGRVVWLVDRAAASALSSFDS